MQDNTMTLVGNLTDEPEVRFTSTGTAVANFTIAIHRQGIQQRRWRMA